MKLLRWTIAILEISFVCFALIVPRVDDPATAFDETDSPVNVTTPLVARTNLVLPAGHSVAIPHRTAGAVETRHHDLRANAGTGNLHLAFSPESFCKLLC